MATSAASSSGSDPTDSPRASEPAGGGKDALTAVGGSRTALLGALFLMATSAIGPGFITQTSVFTMEMGAVFAFAILVSILVDIAIQLNVWRVIGVSGLRANELGNTVVPGLGWVLAAFIFLGGVVFNIGNIAGTGLGANAMFGGDPRVMGGISALIAIGIFLSRRAGVALDRIVAGLGVVMILLMLYVAIVSAPPVGEVLKNTIFPEVSSTGGWGQMATTITTLVGGTVGGYIVFAGAHRLVDAKISGPSHIKQVSRISVLGILVTGVMRVLLFLAIFGVVAGGAALSQDATAADAFRHAAGEIGMRMFGVVLWSASLTSVIGASYTSVSFVTKQRASSRVRSWLTIGFIMLCAVLYLCMGTAPSELLVLAGMINGLILPIGFAVVLWVAWRRRDLLGGYRYPIWLAAMGTAVWLITVYLSYSTIVSNLAKLGIGT